MEATTTPLNPEFRGRGRRQLMLIRREFWEHRALWLLPAVLVGLVLLGSLLALVAPGRINANISSWEFGTIEGQSLVVNGKHSNLAHVIPGLEHSGVQVELGEVTTGNLLRFFGQLPEGVRRQMILTTLLGTGRMLLLPLGLLAGLLALGALRQESRSRSIYFFKSMPMTETEMILAKALAYLPVLLLLMLGTVMAAHLVLLLVLSVAALFAGLNPLTLLWAPAPLAEVWGLTLQGLAVDFLLFLPMAGFLFALNAWHDSRRLMAAVVLFVVGVLDSIYITGGQFFSWLSNHIVPPGWALRGPHGDVFEESMRWEAIPPVNWVDLGSGVLIGLLLFAASTWLLRWREER